MMATTHALAGLLVGSVCLFVAPEAATVALLAGFAGGLAPDLDLYAAHRRTFHFPVLFPLLTIPAVAVAAIAPSAVTIGLAAFVAAAALHAVADVLGGGLELRPWRETSDRAVYSHVHRAWFRPRRLVRYDGSPGDLALAGLLGVAALVVSPGGPVRWVVVASLVVSIGYAVVRKRLPALAEALVGTLVPAPVLGYVPDRYRSAGGRSR